jgi:hypothetical protein
MEKSPRPYLEKTLHKKGAGEVAQDISLPSATKHINK